MDGFALALILLIVLFISYSIISNADDEYQVWIALMFTLLLGIGMLFLVDIGQKEGQIDYLNGEIKYEKQYHKTFDVNGNVIKTDSTYIRIEE